MRRIVRFHVWLFICLCDFAYGGNPPVITSVNVAAPGSALSGYVGCKVILRGTGFSDTKFVRIHKSVVADFTIESDNVITFKAIAVSGLISIQTQIGTGAHFGTEYTNLGYCLPATGYTVGGGGKACSEGTAVYLSDSQNGYQYKLYCDGLDTGKAIDGSGEAIRFENLVKNGVYTIVAVNLKCGLTAEMKGNAVIERQKGTTLYADADDDGYGDPSSEPKIWCEGRPPGGFATNNLDCDDTNPAISPKAPEIPGNNTDDNCDGLVDKENAAKSSIAARNTVAATDIKTAAGTTSCHPNPFDKTFTIAVVADDDATVKVYDVLGKLLDSFEVSFSPGATVLEMGTDYPSGVYKVIVSSGEKLEIFQVIKR